MMALLMQSMPAFALSFATFKGDSIMMPNSDTSMFIPGTLKVNKIEDGFQTMISDTGFILVVDGHTAESFMYYPTPINKSPSWQSLNNPTQTQQEAIDKAILLNILVKAGMTQCNNSLAPIYDLELKQFMDFLETTFQNKSSNSSLMNIAIARYQKFKDRLNDLFSQVGATDSDTDYVEAQNSYGLCSDIKNEYFDKAKKVMIEHIKKTTAIKTTTIMLEKYQSINSKLRDMNTSISQMYGYFMSFKSMLPGFVVKCLTSG